MDLRKLKTLIDLVAESEISELEITEGDGKVKIVKSKPQAETTTVYSPMTMPPAMYPGAMQALKHLLRTSGCRRSRGRSRSAQEEGYVVKAPMVGTFIALQVLTRQPLLRLAKC